MTHITGRQFAIAAVLVALVAWYGSRALRPVAVVPAGAGGVATPAREDAAEPGTRPAPVVTIAREPARRIVVHVAGAVRRPGVYRLKEGERIADALRRAGGGSARADLDAINLAAKARDGVQVLVPEQASAGAAAVPATGSAPGTTPAAPGAPIDLNTATAEQLETLDGVGPATAAKILAHRAQHGPFRSVDDLEQIPGIGPKKLAAIRPGVRV